MWLMRIAGYADGTDVSFAGQYLKSYNPDAPGEEYLAEFTDRVEDAMKFTDAGAVLTEWKRQRMVDGGLRSDGKPDRPLTAFTVEVIDEDKIRG